MSRTHVGQGEAFTGRRQATMVPKGYSPGPRESRLPGSGYSKHAPKEYADWSWAKDEGNKERRRRTKKTRTESPEARKNNVAGLTSANTAKLLQRLGLRPGFWSMLESVCAPLLAPEPEE